MQLKTDRTLHSNILLLALAGIVILFSGPVVTLDLIYARSLLPKGRRRCVEAIGGTQRHKNMKEIACDRFRKVG
jgi:hypothetical protein